MMVKAYEKQASRWRLGILLFCLRWDPVVLHRIRVVVDMLGIS